MVCAFSCRDVTFYWISLYMCTVSAMDDVLVLGETRTNVAVRNLNISTRQNVEEGATNWNCVLFLFVFHIRLLWPSWETDRCKYPNILHNMRLSRIQFYIFRISKWNSAPADIGMSRIVTGSSEDAKKKYVPEKNVHIVLLWMEYYIKLLCHTCRMCLRVCASVCLCTIPTIGKGRWELNV